MSNPALEKMLTEMEEKCRQAQDHSPYSAPVFSPHRVIAMIECIRAAAAYRLPHRIAHERVNAVRIEELEPKEAEALDAALSTLSDSSHASKGESR